MCDSTHNEAPRETKRIETKSRQWLWGRQERGVDSYRLMGVTELQPRKTESSGDRRWQWLHNSVKMLSAGETSTQKWLRWQIVCYMFFITIKVKYNNPGLLESATLEEHQLPRVSVCGARMKRPGARRAGCLFSKSL